MYKAYFFQGFQKLNSKVCSECILLQEAALTSLSTRQLAPMCRPRLAFDLGALLTTSAFCLKQFKVLPDKEQVNLGLQRKKLPPLKTVLSLSHKISYPACRKKV